MAGENVAASGRPCAFGGINPNQATFFLLKPIGRSVYNALQMKLSQNVVNPVRGVKALNFQVSYSLSNFSNTGGAQLTGTSGDSDQDFVLQAADYNKPGRYYGPALLDRTHQISFGGYADVPGGFRLGLIAHFYSPLSSAIVAPVSGGRRRNLPDRLHGRWHDAETRCLERTSGSSIVARMQGPNYSRQQLQHQRC